MSEVKRMLKLNISGFDLVRHPKTKHKKLNFQCSHSSTRFLTIYVGYAGKNKLVFSSQLLKYISGNKVVTGERER